MVYPEEATYPPLERSSYTAGAMILAADALSRTTPASGIFRGEGLPEPSRPHRARPGRARRAGGQGSGGPRNALNRAGDSRHHRRCPPAPGGRSRTTMAAGTGQTRRSTRNEPHSPSSTNSPESRAARQMS